MEAGVRAYDTLSELLTSFRP